MIPSLFANCLIKLLFVYYNKRSYMSKNSAKQRLTQLKEWLAWRKANANTTFIGAKKPRKVFSKADHYKNTRERYGSKSN